MKKIYNKLVRDNIPLIIKVDKGVPRTRILVDEEFIIELLKKLKEENSFFIPIIMLMLFVLSALITGSLVLGKPIMLYLDGQKKQGITTLFHTIISLVVILILVILVYLWLK